MLFVNIVFVVVDCSCFDVDLFLISYVCCSKCEVLLLLLLLLLFCRCCCFSLLLFNVLF